MSGLGKRTGNHPAPRPRPTQLGRGAGSSELLGDRDPGHEFAGAVRAHLRAVVRHGQQQRQLAGGGESFEGVGVPAGQGGPEFGAAVRVRSLQQALQPQGEGEGDLDLGGGFLGGHDGGQPLAGHHVEHGHGGAAGAGEMGEVVRPDVVRLPDQPVRPWRPRRRIPRRIAGQHEVLLAQDPQHGRFRHVHEVQPRPAVGELAVGPVPLAPGLEQLHDPGPFPRQQAVDRVAPGTSVREVPGFAAGGPPVGAGVVHPETGRGPPSGPAPTGGMVDQPQQAGLDACVHTGGDRAGGQSQRAFPSTR